MRGKKELFRAVEGSQIVFTKLSHPQLEKSLQASLVVKLWRPVLEE
jgi:hypothetical protein